MVSHTGIEPVTPWLKVKCSTDWANGSYYGVIDGTWTRDNQCHKLALYQLNYDHHIYEFFFLNKMERETRVELATFSLEGWRSTNWATPAWYDFVVPRAGLEPARDKFPQDFKSCASTDFATKALVTLFSTFLLLTHNYSISISYLNYIVNTFFQFFYIFFKGCIV